MAVRSEVWICDCRLAGITGSNPACLWISVYCEWCVLSSRGFCDGLITRPEESYRSCSLWVWSRNLGSPDPLRMSSQKKNSSSKDTSVEEGEVNSATHKTKEMHRTPLQTDALKYSDCCTTELIQVCRVKPCSLITVSIKILFYL
jgi:hypothetical protein